MNSHCRFLMHILISMESIETTDIRGYDLGDQEVIDIQASYWQGVSVV